MSEDLNILTRKNMATTTSKKMAFSIENLAKSSRSEETNDEDTDRRALVNRIPWQSEDFMNVGNVNMDSYIMCNPYYANHGKISASFSPVQHSSPLSNLRDSFGLSPDEGYSSQNNSPSVSGSDYERKRNDAHTVNVPKVSTPSVTGGSMKRKRIDADDCRSSTPNDSLINSSFKSMSPIPDSDEGIGETPRSKKPRTAFSNDQIEALERRYQAQKYLPAGERSRLAKEHNLTDQQVKTWFQNRRMKEKRKKKDDAYPGGMSIPTGGVDVLQLQALGIPCPPPYTVNNKHEQLMRDDDIPNFPSPGGALSPMVRGTNHVPFYSRFQPMANSLNTLPGFSSPTNPIGGYR